MPDIDGLDMNEDDSCHSPPSPGSELDYARRKRTSKACDFCKSRKKKCNGHKPCNMCLKKSRGECTYSIIDKRSIRYSHLKSTAPVFRIPSSRKDSRLLLRLPDDPSPAQVLHLPQLTSIPTSLQPLLNFPLSSARDGKQKILKPNEEDTPGANPLAENGSVDAPNEFDSSNTKLNSEESGSTRFLYDTNGNLRFIGESSPLSLLAQSRNVFNSIDLTVYDTRFNSPAFKFSKTKFVNDPKRFNIVDAPANRLNKIFPIQLPLRAQCDTLVNLFLFNLNNMVYIFDEDYLRQHIVNEVYVNPMEASPKKLCILYLVLAIGGIFQRTIDIQESGSSSFTERHRQLFESALSILNSTLEDGNLWLVEVYMLIYFYYQASNKRNTSWLNLGTAIRIGESLGLNRKKVNDSFKDREYALHRRKLWRSLYIMDRISSLSLGRPLTVYNRTWDDIRSAMGKQSIEVDSEDLLNEDLKRICEEELVKVSYINGEIYERIYQCTNITPSIAYNLAVMIKNWSYNLPRQLQLETLLRLENLLNVNRSVLAYDRYKFHPALFLNLLYLGGIVLLSRPFFHYHITRCLEDIKLSLSNKPKQHTDKDSKSIVKHFADSCLKSSMLTIILCHYFIKKVIEPLRSYVLTNTIFTSGLVVGLVTLLDIMRYIELQLRAPHLRKEINDWLVISQQHMKIMNRSVEVLDRYSRVDSFAARYKEILRDMNSALTTLMEGARRLEALDSESTLLNTSRMTSEHSDDHEFNGTSRNGINGHSERQSRSLGDNSFDILPINNRSHNNHGFLDATPPTNVESNYIVRKGDEGERDSESPCPDDESVTPEPSNEFSLNENEELNIFDERIEDWLRSPMSNLSEIGHYGASEQFDYNAFGLDSLSSGNDLTQATRQFPAVSETENTQSRGRQPPVTGDQNGANPHQLQNQNVEMELLNAFMYNMNEIEGLGIVFDNTF